MTSTELETADQSRPQSSPFRIAVWPNPAKATNPYTRLFYGALAECGVETVGMPSVNDGWLRERAESLEAIHFHWPEMIWRSRNGQLGGPLRGLASLWRHLALAKKLGLKVFWTVHNIESHEGASWWDRRGYGLLSRWADLLIFLSPAVAEEFVHRYPTKASVVLSPHGNYKGAYPPPNPREQILKRWQLPADKSILCCVGYIRNYKGFDLAIQAVQKLDGQAHLVIAGPPGTHGVQLRSLFSSQDPITLIDRTLSDQEMSDVVHVSEGVLLPYKKISGSGALWLAWTLNRGVVVPELRYFQENCPQESPAVEFFEANNVDSLAAAVAKFLQTPAELRQTAAKELADRHDWRNCVENVAGYIQGLQGMSVAKSEAGDTP